ncbi:hypothetical protein G9A89_008932 [Geosiphon pyriformis]|nr:hypothetical protein G9A89_008932 [Geosiphon pyriformis]
MAGKIMTQLPPEVWAQIFDELLFETLNLTQTWPLRCLSRNIKNGVDMASAGFLRENMDFTIEVAVTRSSVLPLNAGKYICYTSPLPFPVPATEHPAAFSFFPDNGIEINSIGLESIKIALKYKQKSDEEDAVVCWKEIDSYFEFWKMPADHGVWWSGSLGIRYQFEHRESFKLNVHEILLNPRRGWFPS